MPESAAERHSLSTSIHLIQLLDEWAIREMKVCFRKLALLTTCARQLVQFVSDYDAAYADTAEVSGSAFGRAYEPCKSPQRQRQGHQGGAIQSDVT